jgi:hypothetical protein
MNLQYSQGRGTDLKLGIIKMGNEIFVVDADKYKKKLKSTTLIEYLSRPNDLSA